MGNGIMKYKCPKCLYGKVATRIIDGYIHVWCRRCNKVYVVKDDKMIMVADLNRKTIAKGIEDEK